MEQGLPMSRVAAMGAAAGLACVVALESLALAGWMGWFAASPARPLPPAPVAIAAQAAPAIPARPAAPVPSTVTEETYYGQLRRAVRWIPTRIGAQGLRTPDYESRLLLAKSAAQRAGLHEVGLGFSDVYGIINAETSWVPRTGSSKDGTPNLGIAQFEPATARSLGLRDANDPVEAVHMAALHMKEAALWSQSRIAGLKLDAATRAAKLREGVSVYYNLSSRGRAAWDGRNTDRLPRETQLHIRNARSGAQEASLLEAQLRAVNLAARPGATVVTASN